jgi:hypothetical protein
MQRHVARRRLVWSTPFLLHLCCKKGVCRPSFLRKPSLCVWPSFWRWLAYPQRARRTPRLQTLEASRTMCLTTSEPLRSSECQSHTHTHTFSHSFITCHHDASSRATDANATAACDHRSSARAKGPQKDTLNMCLSFSSVEETLLSPTHKAAIEQDGSIRTRTIALKVKHVPQTFWAGRELQCKATLFRSLAVQMLGDVCRLWPEHHDAPLACGLHVRSTLFACVVLFNLVSGERCCMRSP